MLTGAMRSWLIEGGVWRFNEVAKTSGDRVRLPDPEISSVVFVHVDCELTKQRALLGEHSTNNDLSEGG